MSQLIALPCPTRSKPRFHLEAHQKAADYTLAKIKLGNIDGVLGIVILLLLTLGGVINWAFGYWTLICLIALNSRRSGNSHYFSDNDTGRNTYQRLSNLCD